MSPPIENVPTWLVDWGLVTIIDNTLPPRDPNDDGNDDDEDDERHDEDDEPAVIREPEPDEYRDLDLSVGFATIEVMKHVSPHRNSKLAVILFATALIILWGNAAMAMTLNSPAFQQNGHIPSKYTCEGEDVSPPLAWEDAPQRR